MIRTRRVVAAACLLLAIAGCTPLSRNDGSPSWLGDRLSGADDRKSAGAARADEEQGVVANPPAKIIRFDGQETVLGVAEAAPLAVDAFWAELTALLAQQRRFSASKLIETNATVAEQSLWQHYADPAQSSHVDFVADTLSVGRPHAIAWRSLLARFRSGEADGHAYHQARQQFLSGMQGSGPTADAAEQLQSAAQRVGHPLAMVDALRIIALAELAAGRNAQAEVSFLRAAEITERFGDLDHTSRLWLMIATAANRSQRRTEAEHAWRKAVECRAALLAQTTRPLEASFWIRAEEQRGGDVPWPEAVAQALLRYCAPVGCTFASPLPAEPILWCAVGSAQYLDAQPQLALISFKKAETHTEGSNALWLRIAQSRCLAALGQSHAAAALLSGPASSEQPAIAIASTAAMGSAKLQAGAYRQAAQLLHRALNDARVADWPARAQAEADLALAQLIIGDTDQGLRALHAVQEKFRTAGDRASLLQSLENELRFHEQEKRSDAANHVRQRIHHLEQT